MATEYKLSYTAQEIDKKLKEVVPSDFAQNDPSAPDYIKNRTHWAEAPVTTTEVVLEETTCEGFDEYGSYMHLAVLNLVDGAECTVTWDGVEYVSTCQLDKTDGLETFWIGNPVLCYLPGEDNGVPFGIMTAPAYGMTQFISSDTTATAHTIKIVSTWTTQEIHKLDNKYIDAEWIAKKPIGYETIEILPETTVTAEMEWGSGIYLVTSEIDGLPTNGCSTLHITLDGVEYISPVIGRISGSSNIICGNYNVLLFGSWDNGEPYMLMIDFTSLTLFIQTEGEHTLKIIGDEPIYEQLPEGYLPGKFAASNAPGGSALSAKKLDVSAGSTTQPVYFKNGIPVATTHTLGKTVPANAVFTDTTYGLSQNGSTVTLTGSDGTTSSITIPGTSGDNTDGGSGLPTVTTDDNGKTVKVVDGEWSVDKLSYNDLSDRPELFSGNYNDLSDKPTLGTLASKNIVSKTDLTSDVQTSLNKADTALQSYTETDPTVPAWAKASTKPSYTKSEVGLGNVDNVKQYSASNPPPYPVTKVNNKTGNVTLSASDVGADASGTANSVASSHNTNTSAHADIRTLIQGINNELATTVKLTEQTLTENQKTQVKTNLGISESSSSDYFDSTTNIIKTEHLPEALRFGGESTKTVYSNTLDYTGDWTDVENFSDIHFGLYKISDSYFTLNDNFTSITLRGSFAFFSEDSFKPQYRSEVTYLKDELYGNETYCYASSDIGDRFVSVSGDSDYFYGLPRGTYFFYDGYGDEFTNGITIEGISPFSKTIIAIDTIDPKYLPEDITSNIHITADSEMSDTSENPVQNKVIKAYIDAAIGDAIAASY